MPIRNRSRVDSGQAIKARTRSYAQVQCGKFMPALEFGSTHFLISFTVFTRDIEPE
jgi:hypothetical protein